MISVKPDLVLGVILVALLSTPTAYARQAQIQLRTQTQPAAEVKPSSTTNGTTATQELEPVSAPATEPKGPATAPQTPATVRPSNDADDPRAVIDWLLNSSR
jgi:hypothetical protein